MPSVKELSRSRVGASLGLNGSLVPRLFRVEIDDPADDPRAILLAEHPVGSQLPVKIDSDGFQHWGGAAFVSDARITERQGQYAYLVELQYGVPPTLGIGFLTPSNPDFFGTHWRFNVRGASDSEAIVETIKTVLPDGTVVVGAPFGERQFVKVDTAAGANYHVVTPKGTVHLKRGGYRRGQFERDSGTATMTMSRRVVNFNARRLPDIMASKGKLNQFPFFGFDRLHIKFVDWSMDDVPGENEGQTNPGTSYDVSLSFQISAEPLSPTRQVSLWSDPDDLDAGEFAVIRNAGNLKYHEDQFVLKEANFGSLVLIFGW